MFILSAFCPSTLSNSHFWVAVSNCISINALNSIVTLTELVQVFLLVSCYYFNLEKQELWLRRL